MAAPFVIYAYVKRKRILGLDVSTSTVGISVIDVTSKGKIKIKLLDYYKPLSADLNTPDVLDMLEEAKKRILDVIDGYAPSDIAIENIIKFMKGKSSANTTLSLAIINRTLGLAAYERTGIKPTFLNVNTIRAKLKKAANRTTPVKKEDVPEVLESILKIKFPFIYDINKRTKKKKIAAESYDMADALAVSYVYIMSLDEN